MQNLHERSGSLLKSVGLRQDSFKECKENKKIKNKMGVDCSSNWLLFKSFCLQILLCLQVLCGFGNAWDKLAQRGRKRLWGCQIIFTVKLPFLKAISTRLRVGRTVAGYKHIFQSDLCSNDQTNFLRKEATSNPLVYIFLFPLLVFLPICLNFPFPQLCCICPMLPRNIMAASRQDTAASWHLRLIAIRQTWLLPSNNEQCQSALFQLQETDTEQPRHPVEQSWPPSVKNSSFCTHSVMLFISAGDQDLHGCSSVKGRVELHQGTVKWTGKTY